MPSRREPPERESRLVAEAENQTAKQSAAGRSFLEREVSVLSDPPACRDLSMQSRESAEWRTVGWFRWDAEPEWPN